MHSRNRPAPEFARRAFVSCPDIGIAASTTSLEPHKKKALRPRFWLADKVPYRKWCQVGSDDRAEPLAWPIPHAEVCHREVMDGSEFVNQKNGASQFGMGLVYGPLTARP